MTYRFTRLFAGVLFLAVAHGTAAERIERGALRIEGIPEIPDKVAERTRQYQNVRSATLQAWHPAGEGILIRTRFDETHQLHQVRQPGAARYQLTFQEEPVRRGFYSPDARFEGFVYESDVGGGEFYQYFWFDAQTG